MTEATEVELTPEQADWLASQFEAIPSSVEVLSVSEWAEKKRYLSAEVTSQPGYFKFHVTPFLREIADCFSVESPVREVAVMKGVQIGATVGVLENVVGYFIEHVKTAPMMLLTADAELAKLRLESYIIPMLQHSDMEHLIKSSDAKNPRKTGRTEKKIEWEGGGFLIPFGAKSANKLRTFSILALMRDEIDGYPRIVGKDGCPLKLSADRCAAFETRRKILDISTPTIEEASAIASRFALGDQRYYFVRCLKCSFPQVLRWRREDRETGVVSGIVWETESDRLVPGSVRYLCQECGHPHSNDDKPRLLSPEYGAEWKPTAVPISPDFRSYHLSALYSPVGMQTWETGVRKWLEAWDDKAGVPKDNEALQVFYNNVLGETFRVRGEKLRFEAVSAHRRAWYRYGEVPNTKAKEHCGSAVLLVVCSVDVHGDSIKAATWGWCRGRRPLLLSYDTFLGNTELLDDPCWGELRKLIEEREFVGDDGKRYRIQNTMIDSGYRADVVYAFCSDYLVGVYPVKGRDISVKAAKFEEFNPFTTHLGVVGYALTVDIYKDRWATALRRDWSGIGMQPEGHFNAPQDATDAQLKELTTETKVAIYDSSKKLVRYEWRRPSGAKNELWDLLVYANAALDIMAWDIWVNQREYKFVPWIDFWDECEKGLFFSEK